MEWLPAWDHLPAELLLHIARVLGGTGGLAPAKTLLRLVCGSWRAALPIGHCVPAKLWAWQSPAMDVALAPHARAIEVLAPLPHPASSPLPQLALCPRLRSLVLRHIHATALPALGGLAALQELDATVFFPEASPTWLDWLPGLRLLRQLRLAAAQMRLQPDEGLTALLPLAGRLLALRLDGCLLLTDAGAGVLAQLTALKRLEVTSCQVGQAAVDGLAAALPRLAHLELRLLDGVAVDRLMRWTLIGAGGGLAAHVSRVKAGSLLAGAGALMAGSSRLVLRHIDGGFLLTAPPTFHQLRQLESLSLPRIQLPADAVQQLAACTLLQELDCELNYTVRDEALVCWRSLVRMRRLRLAGNFYLSEGTLAAVLRAMPRMQELRLEQVQGSGALLAPLAAMPCLQALELASCHLNDAQALTAALCSAFSLEHLRVQSCGIQSEVCEAAVAALARLPALREVQLGLRRALPRATAEAIAGGCAGCTQLTALDVFFSGYCRDAAVVPAWRQLSALTGLRRLHASTGLGWDAEAFAAVAGAATALRAVTVTDNAGTVDDGWAASLAPLRQLSQLQLNSCARLGPGAAAWLCHLTALTGLEAFRCPGLGGAETVQQLRGCLPCLAALSMHE